MTATASRSDIYAVGRVDVPVEDQDRAIEFYVGRLGFEVRLDVVEVGDARRVEVAPERSSTSLALVPAGERPVGAVGIETGVSLFSDDFEAAHTRLRGLGVDVDGTITYPGGPTPPFFSFRDRDWNSLRVVGID